MLAFISLLLSLSKCIFTQTQKLVCIDYMLAHVFVALVLTLSKYYRWNTDSFMSDLLCFMLQLIFNLRLWYVLVRVLLCHSREDFIFDIHLKALCKKKLLWDKSILWSSQDKTIEIYSYSECVFMWKIFIQSITLHKYFELHIVLLNHLSTCILFESFI